MSNKLTVFRTVADRGNITAASRELNLTQSAVSKVIRQLEERYGAKLLERSPRGVELTELGNILYRHAQSVAVSDVDARAHMQALLSGRVQLRIGAGALWAMSILPNAIIALREEFPEYQADLVVGTRELLLPQLVAGELDIAISQDSEFEHPEIDKYFLAHVPIRAACREDHPLHQLDQPSDADVLQYDWINYQSIKGELAESGDNRPRSIRAGAHVPFSAGSWILCIQIVSQSSLVMGIPDQLLPAAERFGVRPVDKYPLITTLEGYIWVRKARADLSIVKQLIASIQQERTDSGFS
jgi:DNA-binding transcriptional LysR family regulator